MAASIEFNGSDRNVITSSVTLKRIKAQGLLIQILYFEIFSIYLSFIKVFVEFIAKFLRIYQLIDNVVDFFF